MFCLLQLFSETFPLFSGLSIFYSLRLCLWLSLWLLSVTLFHIFGVQPSVLIRKYISHLYHLLISLHTLFSSGFICGFTAPLPFNSFHYNNTSLSSKNNQHIYHYYINNCLTIFNTLLFQFILCGTIFKFTPNFLFAYFTNFTILSPLNGISSHLSLFYFF